MVYNLCNNNTTVQVVITSILASGYISHTVTQGACTIIYHESYLTLNSNMAVDTDYIINFSYVVSEDDNGNTLPQGTYYGFGKMLAGHTSVQVLVPTWTQQRCTDSGRYQIESELPSGLIS